MLLCLEAEKGAAVVDAWLSKSRLTRADLHDETRGLPLAALHVASAYFVAELADGFRRLPEHFLGKENLGAWARMLRSATTPEDALARLDGHEATRETQTTQTVRWETVERRPGLWRGKLTFSHDPALEQDGHLTRLREAELSVVPRLFGYGFGTVQTRTDAGSNVQHFDVRWDVPSRARRVATTAGVGALVGGAGLAAAPSLATAVFALGAPLLAGGFALLRVQNVEAQSDADAKGYRMRALERSLTLREAKATSAPGDLEGAVVASQFRIGARMGSGASGVIYRATRITDGLPVAIKLLRAASAHDAEASDRLRREAEALGLAWHPNVVEVIDHGRLPDGTSYLVMELLVGEPLAHRVETKGRLTPDELLPIALQLTEAIVAVHAAGVVHRDLKPSNIFLAKFPEGERVKIFDFGIARVEWEEMRITKIGTSIGTPGYMSPEQESGGEVDVRSDVFAIGALLYECLVGEPPPAQPEALWRPSTRLRRARASESELEAGHDTLRQIARAESGVRPTSRPDEPGEGGPESMVPAPWRAVIERAIAKRPEERFQTARQLFQAIRELGGVSSLSPPASASGASSS